MNGNAERRLARRAVLGVIALVGSLVTIGVSFMPAQAGTYQLPATVPGAPRDVRVSTGVSGQVTVSWSDPASSGSSDIAGFKVQWKSGDEDYDTTADSARAVFLSGILYWFSGLTRTHTIKGLTDGTEYTIRVMATNESGDGAAVEIAATPGDAVPPSLLSSAVEEAALTLAYDEALDETSVPPPDSFDVTVGGTDVDLESVSVGGRAVTLTLAAAAASTDAVTVSYSAPAIDGSPRIQDTAGLAAPSFGPRVATYRISGICDRTAAVRAAILGAISGVSDCAEVTLEHLAGIRGTLDLSTNSDLRAVQAQDFRYLVNLQKLDLSFNSSIRSLPGGIFDDLSNLRSLRLTHDGLGSLPAGVFDSLTNLEQLNLTYNDLRALPAGVFDSLTNLEYLNLTYNDLRALPGGVFDNLSSLRTLTLGANDLSSLPTRPARDRNSW